MAPSSQRRVRKKKRFASRRSQAKIRDKRTPRASLRASVFGSGAGQQLHNNTRTKLPEPEHVLEENVIEQAPMPESYVFVPKGDIYITRHCRAKAKKARQVVYAVYDNAGKRVQGIRVPADIYAEVSKLAVLTTKARASAVEARDTRFVARGRELLRSQFPLMPDKSLELIIEHSFLKGSGRVGRISTTTDEHKATLAVEAHIRHKHTPYESLLAAGMDRKNARKIVWPAVQAIRDTWVGGDKQSLGCLPMRQWPSGIEK